MECFWCGEIFDQKYFGKNCPKCGYIISSEEYEEDNDYEEDDEGD